MFTKMSLQKKETVTIGVIADTHVPERVRQLDPRIFDVFTNANVDIIFHAGDISTPSVLVELRTIAPVIAVSGNRDVLFWNKLPKHLTTEIHNISIGMTHGHLGLWQYLKDKAYFTTRRYYHAYFLPRLFSLFPNQKIIIFGHGHLPLNRWINGKLFFNPGSPHVPDKTSPTPTVGILTITSQQVIQGEIIAL